MTSTIYGEIQSTPSPYGSSTFTSYTSACSDRDTSTYDSSSVESSVLTQSEVLDRNKENITVKKIPEFPKFKINYNDYLNEVSEEDYSNFNEGFKEIRRLDQILFEKIGKEKEVKLQSILLQKQLLEELEKIKRAGRIEMRDEKANTEKFFALTWLPRFHSNKRENSRESIFPYSPFFQTELQKPDDFTECDSPHSISTMVKEYTEKESMDPTFNNEDPFIDFIGSIKNTKDKVLPSEVLSPDILSDANSIQAINNEFSNQELKDITTDQLLPHDANSVQVLNDKCLNQEVSDVMSDQVLSYDAKPVQVSNDKFLNSTTSDMIADQVVLSGASSNQNINSEPPNQTPSNVVSDQVVLSSASSDQNINNQFPNQAPSDVVSSEVLPLFTNESLHQVALSEMPFCQAVVKEMTPSQNEEHTQMKKKTKKNFIKRNIQLAKDADSVVSMTSEDKNRIDNLLIDLDMLCETPEELQISEFATGDSLLNRREDGFYSSQEDRATLTEIDYKLKYLMTPAEFESVALKRRSPTPSQRLFSCVPSSDTPTLKQFGEKVLLDNKEDRIIKERLKQLDEQLNDIGTRNNNDISEVNSTLEPDVLQNLLESCAVSLTESAANSLCSTARSAISSLDEFNDSMSLSNLSRQTPTDALSSIMKSPPYLADDVLQKLLAEAAPIKYIPLSPISDITNSSDNEIFRRSGSNLSSCTLSSFNSPRKELFNTNKSASQFSFKIHDHLLPEISGRCSLVGQEVSSQESSPR